MQGLGLAIFHCGNFCETCAMKKEASVPLSSSTVPLIFTLYQTLPRFVKFECHERDSLSLEFDNLLRFGDCDDVMFSSDEIILSSYFA